MLLTISINAVNQKERHSVSWELSFIENSDCSTGVGRTVSVCVILVKGQYMQSRADFCRRLLLVLGSH